jgi:hypothetical protein
LAVAGELQLATRKIESLALLAIIAYDAVELDDASRVFSGIHGIAFTDSGGRVRHVGNRRLA